MMKILPGASFLIGVFVGILALPFLSPAWSQGLPKPVPVVGTLKVDGMMIQGAAGDRYRFEITKVDGTPYEPEAVPETPGLGETGFYRIDIPVFDASEQPGGAQIGETAVIHVNEDGAPLRVASPPNGRFTVVEPEETFLIIDIVAERETQANVRPVASASGPDGPVTPGVRVVLDGRDSYDPDSENPLAHRWEQVTNADLNLTGESTVQAEFTVPSEVSDADNPLIFRLTVTDDEGGRDDDTVAVTVSPAANVTPVAMAGADRTVVEEGETVTLNAAGSSDPDGSIDSYRWRQISAGPEIALSDPHGEKTTFVAPAVDVGGTAIIFELTVTDNEGSTDDDDVKLTVMDNGIVAFPEEVLPFWTSQDREMGIVIDKGEIVDLDSDPQVSEGGAPDDRIYGEVAMEIVLDESSPNADFTLYLPEAAPEGHRWYRYRAGDGWKAIDDGVVDLGGGAASRMARSNGDAVDGTRFRMILADGGDVDSDRAVNGRFSGILALGAAGGAPEPDEEDPDHDNSGETNNCFISGAFAGGGAAMAGMNPRDLWSMLLLAIAGLALAGRNRLNRSKRG